MTGPQEQRQRLLDMQYSVGLGDERRVLLLGDLHTDARDRRRFEGIVMCPLSRFSVQNLFPFHIIISNNC